MPKPKDGEFFAGDHNVQDMGLRYDGRVREFHLFVNTDEDELKLLNRIARAAKGMKLNAVSIGMARHDGDQGRAMWAEIQKRAAAAAANPNVVDHDVYADNEED